MTDETPTRDETPAPDSPEAIAGRRLGQLAGLPVTVLRGVGTAVATDLSELGITTVFDLLTHYPRRYIDGVDRIAQGVAAGLLQYFKGG